MLTIWSGEISAAVKVQNSGHFKARLQPMVSTWEGESAVAYNQAQAKWDKASQELNTVLATISKTVSQGNDAMSDVNRRAAASCRPSAALCHGREKTRAGSAKG